jgi:hypothetical protein
VQKALWKSEKRMGWFGQHHWLTGFASKMAGYHEVVYDDGDQYRGDWNAEGKV